MAITFVNMGSSAAPDFFNNVDATSYNSSSHTPPSGVIVCFTNSRTANTDASSPPNIPTVTGNNLTWKQIQSVTFNLASGKNRFRLSLFAADNSANSATAGATSFDFAGQTQTRCDASFFCVRGVDLSSGVTGTFVQSPTNTGTGVLTLSVNLSAAGNSNNRPIAGFVHNTNEDTTARANWTEVDDGGSGSPLAELETQYRSDAFETTASASWASSADVGGIAAELKAAIGSTYNDTVTIAKINAVTDTNFLQLYPTVTVAKKDTVSDANFLQMFQSMTLAKKDTVVDSVSASLAALVSIARKDGITEASIATMNSALSVGRIVAYSTDGNIAVIVTKGYITIVDFSANPVSATSFKASNAGTADFSSSSTQAGSFEANEADTSDFASSGVETEDL